MIISLIGYRGTGKSSVGRKLATELNLPFFDSDESISDRSGQSIAEIFEKQGESEFRRLEKLAVRELMQQPAAVISWGGGVVLDENNRQEIRRSDRIVWLCATAENLLTRLEQDQQSSLTRPALTNLSPLEEIEQNLAVREPLYRTCADVLINTDDLSIEDISRQIVRGLSSLATRQC